MDNTAINVTSTSAAITLVNLKESMVTNGIFGNSKFEKQAEIYLYLIPQQLFHFKYNNF
jgi:hypothetical protein